MPDRSVVTRFEAKVDGYMAGVGKMKAGTEQVSKSTQDTAGKSKRDFGAMGTAATAAGAVIGVALLKAVKSYADFEAAMSRVAAVSGATAIEQEKLSKAAIQAGQDTVFSATEAAKAQEELLKAGVATADVLGGALRGSLDLAAAGGLDLAKSAEIAAQAMNIFNKSGSDVGHIADVLTAGANKSAAGVDDLGMALSQGGLLAKQTGLTLEDTVGVLSAFADNALKGSDAGTSLKTMLQRLTPQSKEQAKAMDALGLSFYDADGQFIGIAESAGRLQKAFKDLTPEQRNSALQTIFGSDAVRGANILMEQGEAGVRKYIAAVNDQGAAQRMAARMTDNLKGDLEQLQGTLESAFINAGSGGNDAIRSLVQSLTSVVDKFNQLSPSAQSYVVKAAAVAAGTLLLAGATTKVVTSLTTLRTAYAATAFAGSKYEAGLARGAKAAGKLSAALAAVALASQIGGADEFGVNSLAKDLASAEDPLKAINAELARSTVVANGTDFATKNLGASLRETFDPGFFNKIQAPVAGLVNLFGGDFKTDTQFAAEQLDSVGQALAKMVADGRGDQAAKVFQQIAAEAKAQGISTDDLLRKMPAYQEALDQAAVAAKGAGDATAGLSEDLVSADKAAREAADGTKAFADELQSLNQPALDARSAAREVEQAFDDASAALKENGRNFDINSEKGRKNQAALDDVASALNSQIGAMQANGASQATLDKKVDSSRARLEALARQFGLSKSEARKYIDQVLQTPKAISTTFSAKTAQAKKDLAAIQSNINRLRGQDIRIPVRYVETGPRPGGGRSTAGGVTKAAGGPVFGAGTATSDSIPAMLSNGEHVLTASDVQKAGGQNAIYRMRAGIQAGALRFAKGGAVGFAEGGEVDWSSILDILQDITTSDDVTQARQNSQSRVATYKAARASLTTMRKQLAAANRAVAAARKTKGRGDDNRALEQRRQLLAKIEVQEVRVALATSKSLSARKTQIAVEKEYAADRRKVSDRFLTAASSSNATSKKFLDNIDKLTRMGFKTLALELLNQGGSEAEGIAEQAVVSAAKAKALETQIVTSKNLDERAQKIRDALEGKKPEALAAAALGAPAALSWYAQLRDLGPLRGAAGRGAPTYSVSLSVPGLVVDPVGTGKAIEKALQQMASTLGQPVDLRVRA